jgi:RecA/RadA recombinase
MLEKLTISTRDYSKILLERNKITHVYGPPKVGKSTLSAVLAMELSLIDKRTIIISTERPIEIRLESMIESYDRYSKHQLENIFTANIFTLEELLITINNDLSNFAEKNDLIIIDSLTSSYRTNASPITLTLLRKALSKLQRIAFASKVAIFFTNQVASKMDSSNNFRPVASATTRNYSDFTIRLTKTFEGKTETVFEDSSGEEEFVLEPFLITVEGILDFNSLFIID